MLEQADKPESGSVVSRVDGCEGTVMYSPCVPSSRTMDIQRIALIVVVGAPKPPSKIHLAPRSQVLDVPNANTDPLLWWRTFNKSWQVALHTLRAGKAVCVCPAVPGMLDEAPHVMACLRGKLSGSKPVQTLDRIMYGYFLFPQPYSQQCN